VNAAPRSDAKIACSGNPARGPCMTDVGSTSVSPCLDSKGSGTASGVHNGVAALPGVFDPGLPSATPPGSVGKWEDVSVAPISRSVPAGSLNLQCAAKPIGETPMPPFGRIVRQPPAGSGRRLIRWLAQQFCESQAANRGRSGALRAPLLQMDSLSCTWSIPLSTAFSVAGEGG
jgi:hypothetical protein